MRRFLGEYTKMSFRGLGEEDAGGWRRAINGIHGMELVRMNSPFNELKNTVEVMCKC